MKIAPEVMARIRRNKELRQRCLISGVDPAAHRRRGPQAFFQ